MEAPMRRDRVAAQHVELFLSTILLVLLAVSLTVAGIHLERHWYAQDVAADDACAVGGLRGAL